MGGVIYTCPKYNVQNHFLFCKWWKDFFEEHREYQIVHGHLMGSASVYLSIAKKYGRTAISHSHNVNETRITLYYLTSRIYELPVRWIADYFFACSETAGKFLFGNKVVHSERFRIMENGIDTERFIFSESKRKDIRKKYHIGSEFVIGNVARLYYQKNYSFLLDVLYELKKLNEIVKLLVVGIGPEMEMLREKSVRLGLMENVIFAGAHSNTESFYSAMDVFVCPSHFEGLSIATVEAQATGLLCVVSEGVPSRADIGAGLYRKLMLSDGAVRWARYIYKHIPHCRNSQKEKVREAGFDIRNTAEEMEKFYKGL